MFNYTYVQFRGRLPERRRYGSPSERTSRACRRTPITRPCTTRMTRFSSRISGAYRDEYLTATAPGRNGADVEGTTETFNLDFSATPITSATTCQFTVRGAEPDQRVPGSVGGLAARPAVLRSPHRSSVLPRTALQALTPADRPPWSVLPGASIPARGGGARVRYTAGSRGNSMPREETT